MLDFLIIDETVEKHVRYLRPDFAVKRNKDIMIQGHKFYAVYDAETGFWSKDEYKAIELIDKELQKKYEELAPTSDEKVKPLYLRRSRNGSIDAWNKFTTKQAPDNFHSLDEKLLFASDKPTRNDYVTRKLKYDLKDGPCTAYTKAMNVLYSPENRHKFEWVIGCILAGDSKSLQKFVVIYGPAGTGKSTVLNLIEKLFEGFYCAFDSKALGSNTAFPLEAFRTNPLVAIQHDGDLSRIEDNTKINSLVSHEVMSVNAKYKSPYEERFNSILFMGTNKPVRITDSKSGLLRRLIDVSPTGNKLSPKDYKELTSQFDFELGEIANHCLEVYESNPDFYDYYVPVGMVGSTDAFYNFVQDSFELLDVDQMTLSEAYSIYLKYCEMAGFAKHLDRMDFKEELKSYYTDFKERAYLQDNQKSARNVYSGFIKEKFSYNGGVQEGGCWLDMTNQESVFDKLYSNCRAQYAKEDGTPSKKWSRVTTRLVDLNTSNLHYVQIPENHIVIDFDLKNRKGEKDFDKNFEAARGFPRTYAELSKSGAGIHLHYIYDGDVDKLSRIYDNDIEVKVYKGDSSLRRLLTKCNNSDIAHLSEGVLPLKGEHRMVNFETIKDTNVLMAMIVKNLNKEYHGHTAPSVSFIKELLDQAYNSGMEYDLTKLYIPVKEFAASSTNQADKCLKMVEEMHFKSDDVEPTKEELYSDVDDADRDIYFFDIESFPDSFFICYMEDDDNAVVHQMINPTTEEVQKFLVDCKRLAGYNCKRYDNHLVYASSIGYKVPALNKISRSIIDTKRGEQCPDFFGPAWNMSYVDIYDMAAAGHKQSLKKYEIELGLTHIENHYDWTKPVGKEHFQEIADYCSNDVRSTRAVFHHLKDDWIARKMLAKLAGGTVNMSTNSLSTKFIFEGEDSKSELRWRDLSKPVLRLDDDMRAFLEDTFPEMMSVRHGSAGSLLPYFEGYTFVKDEAHPKGYSVYKGIEVGEGGAVIAKHGIWYNVKTADVASMHPHSAMAEYAFGKYTYKVRDIIRARIAIKHKDYEAAGEMLNGVLKEFLKEKASAKGVSNALKTVINSLYGLSDAGFDNPCRNPDNVDNIVAKRGALTMIDLKDSLEDMGVVPIHIKTDSIKVVNMTTEIENYIYDFGKRYGYTFEIESHYEKMCLVNNAVYIALRATDDPSWLDECEKAKAKGLPEPTRWTATGEQFAVPYVFKTLFSHEDVTFDDLKCIKSVKSTMYLDFNENLPDVSKWEKVRDVRTKLKRYENLGKVDKMTKSELRIIDDYKDMTDEEIAAEIAKGHNYGFVGKVGAFVPIKPGCGGGLLLYSDDMTKFSSVTGTKGWRWMETDVVKNLGMEDCVDYTYYRSLVDDAVSAIEKFGVYETFVNEEPEYPDWMTVPEDSEPGVPWE